MPGIASAQTPDLTPEGMQGRLCQDATIAEAIRRLERLEIGSPEFALRAADLVQLVIAHVEAEHSTNGDHPSAGELPPLPNPTPGSAGTSEEKSESIMFTLLGILLLVWVVCIILGVVIHGLFWLLIIGAILLVATGVLGWLKREALGQSRR